MCTCTSPTTTQAAARALVHHGPLPARDVARFASLPPADARRALLVLLQHNLAIALPPPPPPPVPPAPRGVARAPPPRPRPAYSARPAALLHVLRLPRCVAHVRRHHGRAAAALAAALAEHGRLRAEQAVAAAAARLRADAARADADAAASPASPPLVKREHGDEEAAARAALTALAAARLIERAPPPTLAPHARAVPAPPTRGGGARGRGGFDEEEDDDGAAEAEAEYGRVRFNVGVIDAAPSAPVAARAPARKRKARAPTPPDVAAPPSTPASSPPLFRLNAAEFGRAFRCDACVCSVAARRGPAVGAVLAAVLSASSSAAPPASDDSLEDVWPSVDRSAVVAALDASARGTPRRMHAGGESTPRTDVDATACLATLAEDGCIENSGRDRVIPRATAMLARARSVELTSTLRARHGDAGARVFRLLDARPQLEAKAVAEAAMLPAKEGRALLYTLLGAGAVALQDVPRGADRAPSRTLYTWRADGERAAARLGAEAAFAAGNALARLAVEAERARVSDAVAALKSAAAGGDSAPAGAPPVTAARAAQLRAYSARRRVLWDRVLALERTMTLLIDA